MSEVVGTLLVMHTCPVEGLLGLIGSMVIQCPFLPLFQPSRFESAGVIDIGTLILLSTLHQHSPVTLYDSNTTCMHQRFILVAYNLRMICIQLAD